MSSPSRGRQRHHEEEHEEHVNHEAWVIPYADVLTLLMALFLVMFAIGRTDNEKFELAAQSFREELGGGKSPFDLGLGTGGAGPLAAGGASVLDGAGPAPVRSDVPDGTPTPPITTPEDEPISPPKVIIVPDIDTRGPLTSDSIPDATPGTTAETVPEAVVPIDGHEPVEGTLGDPLSDVERVVREQAEGTGLLDSIGFRREARGLVVTIVTDKVLFDEADATIQAGGESILHVISDALRDLPNAVVVEGHTDARPISTSRFPSNWELSTARSVSVLRFLVEETGFPLGRISASGYADTHPVDPGTSAEAMAKNRRVEIVVLATT